MALVAGSNLGHYLKVVGLIGQGGMGEVYRAHDSKLDRDVAIKLLPEQFARDPERLARFRCEAQLLASLNHPNIATIHGIEESAGTHFLVMEMVEGETLHERVSQQGAVPLEESLDITKQICEALEHDRYYGALHEVTQCWAELLWTAGQAADERRNRVLPCLLTEPKGVPDVIGLGPESPIDERARQVFFGEIDASSA